MSGTTALDPDKLADYMRQAVVLSATEVARGGIPFAGIVVHPDKGVLGRGVNRVLELGDPTAHAEIVALRDAAQNPDNAPDLGACAMLASGEPCGMCYRYILNAGITTIFYAIDRDEAAQHGFDYRRSYRTLGQDPRFDPEVTVQRLLVDDARHPFTSWLARNAR